MNIIRQGDVLLVKVHAIPAEATEVKEKSGCVILAYGEVTGHCHQISEPAKAKLWHAGAERFLQVMERTSLRHEEHSSARIDPGVYHVAIQREYTPQALRNVQD